MVRQPLTSPCAGVWERSRRRARGPSGSCLGYAPDPGRMPTGVFGVFGSCRAVVLYASSPGLREAATARGGSSRKQRAEASALERDTAGGGRGQGGRRVLGTVRGDQLGIRSGGRVLRRAPVPFRGALRLRGAVLVGPVPTAGDLPCASAWMRCFIVGAVPDQWPGPQGRRRRGSLRLGRAVAVAGLPVCGTAAAAAVVMRPSAVHSARKAVTTVFHSFMTLFLAMAPHFRVGRFAYFPHDVYEVLEVVDRRPRRVDVQMNTTRMGA